MYNDYYLQSIDNKLTTMIQNQNTQIQYFNSGDINIEYIKEYTKATNNNVIGIAFIVTIILIYKFIERCFR